MDKVSISGLSPKRWKEYRNLRLEALRREPYAFNISHEEAIKTPSKKWKKRLNKNPDPFLFAFVNDFPVGLLQIVYEKSKKLKHVAYISQFYISKEYRGRGIGKKLLEKAINIIKEKNIRVIRIGVYEKQESAIKLYRKLGFTIIGTYKRGIKVGKNYYDEILLERLL